MNLLKFILFVILILSQVLYVKCTHFRYASLQWASTTVARTVNINLKAAFSISHFTNLGITYQVGDKLSYGEIYFYDKVYYGNDAYASVSFTITAVHPQKDLYICMYSYSLTHQYADISTFTAYYHYDDGYVVGVRGVNQINNAELPFYIDTDLALGRTGVVGPTVGMYPIIDMYQGQVNTYQVVVADTNTPISQLVFSLQPGSKFTGYSSNPGVQPPGFSISSTGLITFNPPSIGYYNAQIKVYDPVDQTYTSSDFLINSRSVPTTPLPIVLTPPLGSITTFMADEVNQIMISAYSPDPSTSVSILVADAPMTATLTTQIGTNPCNITLIWKPPITNANNFYIVSVNLVDSYGVSLLGAHSFVIKVQLPVCGSGTRQCTTASSCICVCNTGWTGAQCDQCLPNTYGLNCSPVQTCVNGVSSTGANGDGSCLCNQGWTGPSCNQSLIARCTPTQQSYIIGTTSSVLVTPSNAQIYLSPTVSPVLTVPITLASNPLINILLLVDETASATSAYQQIKSQYSQFVVGVANAKVSYALGKFSDSSSVIDPFTLIASFKGDISAEVASLNLVAGTPTAGPQYRAISQAVLSAPWTQNAYRILILITDNDLSGAPQSDVTNAVSQLILNNVQFGVMAVDSVSSYNSFISQLGYGRASAWTSSTPWPTTMLNNIYTLLLNDVYIIKKKDTNGFVVQAPTNSSSGQKTFSSTLQIPSGSNASSPSVQYQVVGYGYQNLNIQFNHPPTTAPLQLSLYQGGQSATFSVQSFDQDLNILTVEFQSVPTIGILSYSGGTVQALTQYPANTVFTVNPSLTSSGNQPIQFNISDGCLSVTSTFTLTIIDQNTPPTCFDQQVSSSQTSSQPFTIQGTDNDGDVLTIAFPSLSALSSIGSLVFSSNQNMVIEGQSYPSPMQLTFKPQSTASEQSIPIQYVVYDGSVSSQCKLTITIVRVNSAPLLQILDNQTTIPYSTKTIPFVMSDLDANTIVNVTITSITPNGGTFKDQNGVTISSTPYSLGQWQLNGTTLEESSLSFIAPSTSPTVSSFNIKIQDSEGLSNNYDVQINTVGSRTNSPPTATFVSPFYINQGSETALFNLTGTDPDTQFDKTLNVIISALPTFGEILNSQNQSVLSNGPSPMLIKYRPTPTFYGTDELVFNVEDTLGTLGLQSVTVKFFVAHINHYPTGSLPDIYASNSNQDPIPINTIANDFDHDTLTGIIVTLPQYGQLTQYDGTPITTSNTQITNSSLFLYYQQPTNFFSSFNTTYSIKVCDNASLPLCTPLSANIYYTHVNTPPIAYDQQEDCQQGKSVTIQLNCTDAESSNLQGKIVSLPLHGSLKTTSGTPITSTTQLVPTVIVYTPNPDESDAQTTGGLGPLETILYLVRDEQGIESMPAKIQVFVEPAEAPVYQGALSMSINEDTPLVIPIKATPGSGGNINMYLMDFNGRGTLQFLTGVQIVDVTTTPSNFSFTNPQNIFKYTPNKDDTGQTAYLIFNLYDGSQVGPTLNLSISVLPVNDIPLVVPVSYETDGDILTLQNLVLMNVNSSAVISWTDNDIDSPDNEVQGIVTQIPKLGTLYNYDPNSTDHKGTIITENGVIVNRTSDASFKVVYQGILGDIGINYTDFSVAVSDLYNQSSAHQIRIDIRPINHPPSIQIPTTFYQISPNSNLSISGVSVDDPDASVLNSTMQVTLSLGALPGSSLTNGDWLKVHPVAGTSCITSTYSIQCNNTKYHLNSFINSIDIHIGKSGNYTVRIEANDLGLQFPGVLPLTTQNQIAVLVGAPTPGTSTTGGGSADAIVTSDKPKKNLALMISLIVVGCVLVLLVLGFLAYRYYKRSRPIPPPPPTGSSFAGQFNISNNPLYNSATKTMKHNKKLKLELANIQDY
ncbi:type A von Willebrand factor domain-containing protein [Tieghemostelium lacteum]|uniref:Type A von Willebrand factor domain-containing protein n=1 Tax=Tieghemostelium lacteum TaxID=361077 RepID=A0A151Z325_TIELA|nr:type A von Willebrand factor domain-containing protein [Tieghemostelium lacteum]|eukprot:KYQ88363.1 type A von Willebrand factor domain-containing protein [Tieghemostelium lacteum]